MNEAAFVEAVKPYRQGLHAHCYRMSGSLEDAEDLVQETLLRAWRGRSAFAGRSTMGTWLYRIATNASLDLLARRPRRGLPPDRVPAADPASELPEGVDGPWLDPYPGPDATVESRETLELAFLAAIQCLTPRRRAVVLLRDVLAWPARDTAEALAMSVASVNSTLQRSRAVLRERLGPRREDWERPSAAAAEVELLRRYMEAHEQGDAAALAVLLHEDVRISAPPRPLWYDGKTAALGAARRLARPGAFRFVPTRANGRPAAASYRRADNGFVPMGIDVLRIEDGLITEVTAFLRPDLFGAFDLPAVLA